MDIAPDIKCPHCGKHLFSHDCKPLTPTHSWPHYTRQVCPGSHQIPRELNDPQPLTKDIENLNNAIRPAPKPGIPHQPP